MPQVVSKEQLRHAMHFKKLYSRYQEVRELIPLGGYQPGNDPEMDQAVLAHPKLVAFLQQEMDELAGWDTVNDQMNQLIQELNLG